MEDRINRINKLSQKFDSKCESLKLKIDKTLYDLDYKSVDILYNYLHLEIDVYEKNLDELDIDSHIFSIKLRDFINESFNKFKRG